MTFFRFCVAYEPTPIPGHSQDRLVPNRLHVLVVFHRYYLFFQLFQVYFLLLSSLEAADVYWSLAHNIPLLRLSRKHCTHM